MPDQGRLKRSRRVAGLILEDVEPAQIIAFTFTDRAAQSLRTRITRRVTEARLKALERNGELVRRMNDLERELLDCLIESTPTEVAKSYFARTPERFVLDYGWLYEPTPVPPGIQPGTKNECHANAARLYSENNTFVYCEGFALLKSGATPRIHAWVTDGHGAAIDNTWPQPGVAYAGVPFKTIFVTLTTLKNQAFISLIDDYMNDYPLLRPAHLLTEEWFEDRGVGKVKIGIEIGNH